MQSISTCSVMLIRKIIFKRIFCGIRGENASFQFSQACVLCEKIHLTIKKTGWLALVTPGAGKLLPPKASFRELAILDNFL